MFSVRLVLRCRPRSCEPMNRLEEAATGEAEGAYYAHFLNYAADHIFLRQGEALGDGSVLGPSEGSGVAFGEGSTDRMSPGSRGWTR